MVMLGDVFRVVDILLAICYMPLLVLRVTRTNTPGNVGYLVGIFFILVSIIIGSTRSLGHSFSVGQPFLLVGLVCLFASSIYNEHNENRQR